MQSQTTPNSKPADVPSDVTKAHFFLLTQLTSALAQNQPGIQTTEFLVVAGLLVVDVILTSLGRVLSRPYS